MMDQQRQHPSSFDDLGGGNRAQRRAGVRVGGKRGGKSAASTDRLAAIRAALPHAPQLTAEEQTVADAIEERVLDGAARLSTVHPNGRDDLLAVLVRTVAQRAVAALHPGQHGDSRVDYLGILPCEPGDHPVPVELSGPVAAHEWLARELPDAPGARVVIRTTTLRELR